jgi:16S rRNA G966 N2-methylase RsmD
MSRGCQQVISVEMDRDHHRFICECIKKLGDDSCIHLRADVFRFIKSCHQQFDFIFADPPYALKDLPKIPDLVFEKGILKEDGIFVFEHGKDHDFSAHPHFVEHRSYGSVNFSLFTSKAKVNA